MYICSITEFIAKDLNYQAGADEKTYVKTFLQHICSKYFLKRYKLFALYHKNSWANLEMDNFCIVIVRH